MLLEKIKEQIKENAILAVKKAEKELGSSKGIEKKQQAVSFVVSRLPVTEFFKPIAGAILSKVIDDAVEFAVYCMNLLCEDK